MQDIIYSLTYHKPNNFPCIVNRQLAYKDFENGGESWCSISNSPMLEDGDIIQIIRKPKIEFSKEERDKIINRLSQPFSKETVREMKEISRKHNGV